MTRIGPNNDSNGKPYVYDELLARMHAILRRVAGQRPARLEVQDLEIDLSSRVVRVAGESAQLSAYSEPPGVPLGGLASGERPLAAASASAGPCPFRGWIRGPQSV